MDSSKPKGSTRRALFLTLLVASAGVILVVTLAALTLAQFEALRGWRALVLLAGLALCLLALWILQTLLDGHFDDLKRVEGDILSAAQTGRLPLRPADFALSEEADHLAQTAQRALERRQTQSSGDRRLGELLALVGEGLLVITDSGLVSLVNAAAQSALPKGVAPGHSIYAQLLRDDVMAVEAQARAAQRPVEASLRLVEGGSVRARVALLGDQSGLVISLLECQGWLPAVSHDLTLHDRPAEATPPRADSALAELPLVVLDCETTGLDVTRDRIVSLAAVRLQGDRIFPHLSLDRLVNPGQAIPAASTRIHGISDKMVERAPPFAAHLPELVGFLQNCVLVGHNIGFDLALLAREAQLAGQEFVLPPTLDTGRLAAALEPKERDINLESIAKRLGIAVEGRHTALGDCLVTAEVWRRLLAQLEARGIHSLGQAQAFAQTAKAVVAVQRQRGWLEGA